MLPETPPPSFDEYSDEVADQWIPHKTPLRGPPEPPLFDYDRDFPPLNRSIQRSHLPSITPKTPLPLILPSTPRETSFSSPAEASVSPLRKKLPSLFLHYQTSMIFQDLLLMLLMRKIIQL